MQRANQFPSLLLVSMMLAGASFSAETLYPLWDGKESVADYAKRVDLPPSLTLDLGNNVKLELALIPAGSFVMGSPETEEGRRQDRHQDEQTLSVSECQRKVIISRPFYMGKHEVTQAQYKQIMGKNPTDKRDRRSPLFAVTNVTWSDCRAFCKELGKKSGRAARLPTEAEWEYACRAGTTTPFNTGATILPGQANYFCSKPYGKDGKVGKPSGPRKPVGSYPPNGFGLHDMHGNVDERCLDLTPIKLPDGGVDPIGQGNAHAVRGGCWGSIPHWSRSAWRCDAYKTGRWASSGDNTGFRITVRLAETDPEPPAKKP